MPMPVVGVRKMGVVVAQRRVAVRMAVAHAVRYRGFV